MFNQFEETLTFDDVLLTPQHSTILPKDAELGTWLTPEIRLNLPFLSAPMDTVTESQMAIVMALAGGMGIIHKNLSIDEQVREVEKVKRFKNGFIENPISVRPDDKIAKVIEIREQMGFKKNPVIDEAGRLVGMISDVDYFISKDAELSVKDRMVPVTEMVIAKKGIGLEEANAMLREHRLRALCVVDDEGKLVSMVTRKDIEKNTLYPNAVKNEAKQLRVGAAVSVGTPAIERVEALIKCGVDVIVMDTAHGHSAGVLETVKIIKQKYPNQSIIAGNIATAEGAQALVEAGVDAVKVGIGPGSICTTRIVAGVGVPQLSAILAVVKGMQTASRRVPIIADGGIKNSGDIVKALAAGASTVMMGNMFAGTDESPGRVEFVDGRMFKIYRGMGSLEAMEHGSKDRYGQAEITQKKKFVPEGVSGRVAYKGPVERIVYQLAGGLRSGMGYCGARTIDELRQKANFVRITGSGLKESHPHDLRSFDKAPNYGGDEE
jgi:IMP dehydrogenase